MKVMVLELAQHVQTCLHKHNKPQLSFYDKMMANKREEKERQLAAEREKQQLEIEANKEREENEVGWLLRSEQLFGVYNGWLPFM